MERLLSLQEAAELAGVSKFTLRRWARLQRVGVVRLSKRAIRFRQSDLDALVRTHLQPARGLYPRAAVPADPHWRRPRAEIRAARRLTRSPRWSGA